MIILGIDPGLTRCGYGVVETKAARKVDFVEVGVFQSLANAPIETRIGEIGLSIEALLVRVKPAAIAIERVFAQANLRSVMGTAQISGVVLNLAYKHQIPIAMYTPSEVKAAVTGSGRAAKAQVGFMVAKLLSLAEVPKPADAADSLAIAICHAWKGAAAQPSSTATTAQIAWLEALAAAKQGKR